MTKDEMIEKSVVILQEKVEACAVSSVSEEGYPRIAMLCPIGSQGIKTIYFSTGNSGTKMRHYRKNNKAGVTFFSGGDSVTLVGKMTIVTDMDEKKAHYSSWMDKHFAEGVNDPDFALLRFDAHEATIYIDEQFDTYEI